MAEVALTGAEAHGPGQSPACARFPQAETAAAAVGWRLEASEGGSSSIARAIAALPCGMPGQSVPVELDVSPVVKRPGRGSGAENAPVRRPGRGKAPLQLCGLGRDSSRLAGCLRRGTSASAAIGLTIVAACLAPARLFQWLLMPVRAVSASELFLIKGIRRGGPGRPHPRQFQKGFWKHPIH